MHSKLQRRTNTAVPYREQICDILHKKNSFGTHTGYYGCCIRIALQILFSFDAKRDLLNLICCSDAAKHSNAIVCACVCACVFFFFLSLVTRIGLVPSRTAVNTHTCAHACTTMTQTRPSCTRRCRFTPSSTCFVLVELYPRPRFCRLSNARTNDTVTHTQGKHQQQENRKNRSPP